MNRTLYNYTIKNGQLVFLGQKAIDVDNSRIGGGGEGTVYSAAHGKYIKLYNWKKNDIEEIEEIKSKFKKIVYMISNAPEKIDDLGWPESMLFSSNTGAESSFSGFVMKAFRGYHSIGNVYDTDERNKIFGSITWNFLFTTARNIAFVVEQLHNSGYILGDINEGNILVDDHAQVAFIDCDSYKIIGNSFGEKTVGMDEYTPPERLKIKKLGVENIDQERFSLAILLFKILMLGAHPYNVLYSGKGEIPLRMENIIACRSIFSKTKIPPSTPPLWVLPDRLLNLFKRAFGPGCSSPDQRPSSAEWYKAFESVRNQIKPLECNVNSNHIYFESSKTLGCPWCTYQKQIGIDPFPSTAKNSKSQGVKDDCKAPSEKPDKHSVILRFHVGQPGISLENYINSLRSKILKDHDLIGNRNEVLVEVSPYYHPNTVIAEAHADFGSQLEIDGLGPGWYSLKVYLTNFRGRYESKHMRMELGIHNVNVIDPSFPASMSMNKFDINLSGDFKKLEIDLSGDSKKADKDEDTGGRHSIKFWNRDAVHFFIKYATLPVFAVYISAISILMYDGYGPPISTSVVALACLIDFFGSKYTVANIMAILTIIVANIYAAIEIYRIIGLNSLPLSSVMSLSIYALIVVYSIAATIILHGLKKTKMERLKNFLPAAIIPILLILLHALRIL